MSGIAGEARLDEAEGDRADGQGGDANDHAMARDPRVASIPAAPTKAMILAHEVHHADYREWCAHCVAGKGVSHKHMTSDGESRSDTAEFCLDYAFMTEEGRVGYLEDIGLEDVSGMSPVLVGGHIYCSRLGVDKDRISEDHLSASDLPEIDADISITDLDAYTASDHGTAPDDYTASEYRAASDDIDGPYDSELVISETQFGESDNDRLVR